MSSTVIAKVAEIVATAFVDRPLPTNAKLSNLTFSKAESEYLVRVALTEIYKQGLIVSRAMPVSDMW